MDTVLDEQLGGHLDPVVVQAATEHELEEFSRCVVEPQRVRVRRPDDLQ